MADPISAGIMAGGSLISGITGGKGASKAAKAQAAAHQAALAQQQAQFEQTRADQSPFLNAGVGATEQLRRLLGLGDSATGAGGPGAYAAAEQQQGAIAGTLASPLFTSRYNTGLDAILQSASATGGLRGGNTQNSLAQFGSALSGDVIQQQMATLMQLAGLGAGTGATLAGAGQANANAQSNLYTQQGNARATGILGQTAATTGTVNDLSKILQSVTGGGGKF